MLKCLDRRQLVGSRETAIETVHVLRQVVLRAKFTHFEQLVDMIKQVGHKLVAAQPKGVPTSGRNYDP